MLKVIDKRSFTPVLTTMQFNSEQNAFAGTDSFILFEFIPTAKVTCDSFHLTYSQLGCLDKMCDSNGQISFRSQVTLESNKKLIEVLGSDSTIYFPIEDQKFPHYDQPSIRGEGHGKMETVYMAKSMETFLNVGQIICPNIEAIVTDKTLLLEHNDER